MCSIKSITIDELNKNLKTKSKKYTLIHKNIENINK
jgi:hypothetical protein